MTDMHVNVVARLKSLEEMDAPLISFLHNPSLVQELHSDKQYNLQMLKERYQVCGMLSIVLFMYDLHRPGFQNQPILAFLFFSSCLGFFFTVNLV